MSRRSATTVVLSLALAAVLAAGATAAAKAPSLPPGWTHVSVNVVLHRVPYTLVYNRGRITVVGAGELTVTDNDGSVWQIPVSSSAQVTLDGQPASLTQLQPREVATTLQVDDGAASKVAVVIPPRLAAALARQQARQAKHQAGG